jgi:hypothetical protein
MNPQIPVQIAENGQAFGALVFPDVALKLDDVRFAGFVAGPGLFRHAGILSENCPRV